MKIYIVGSIASGKSTLAKKMSKSLGISYQSLDEIVHVSDKTNPWGNRKRSIEERDSLFYSVINKPSWIMEDTGRPCFEEGLKIADTFVLPEYCFSVNVASKSVKLSSEHIEYRWVTYEKANELLYWQTNKVAHF